MIDTHAHLDDEKFDEDRGQVLQRSFDSGVEKIINIGADLEGSRGSIELSSQYDSVYASVGLHPHVFNDVIKFENNFENINDKISKLFYELEILAKNKKVVAIGEIGLDYFSHSEDPITLEQKENQKKGFIAQIELARKLELPVVVHCREAYKDTFEIIKNYPTVRFVFHCYGGSLEFTKKILELENVLFSFTGNITYAKASSEAIGVVEAIPSKRMMLETDCPYLAPVPHRGKRNEPAYVSYVCEKIAEIKQISAKEIEKQTTENAVGFFGL